MGICIDVIKDIFCYPRVQSKILEKPERGQRGSESLLT